MKIFYQLTLLYIIIISKYYLVQCFFLSVRNTRPNKTQRIQYDDSFIVPDAIAAGIKEDFICIETVKNMKRVIIPISTNIHTDGYVGISYSHWPAAIDKEKMTNNKKHNSIELPPVILIHSFDSSNLEFRSIGPLLASAGIETYAVDLLGCGYTQRTGVIDFSAKAEIEALHSFAKHIVGHQKPFCIAGSSLGGAAAIEMAATNQYCTGLILLAAQGFMDGLDILNKLPTFITEYGVKLLKAIPCRTSGINLLFHNKTAYATTDATIAGSMHCYEDGWSDAMIQFMQSGGFHPSKFVSKVQVPSLILWGKQDNVLNGKYFGPKFLKTLPDARMEWIDQCGHIPHLEQPRITADHITDFVKSSVREKVEEENMIMKKKKEQRNNKNAFRTRVSGVVSGLSYAAAASAASLQEIFTGSF